MSFFFFICLVILFSLLTFVFSNRSLGTFFHGFHIPFPFPDSGFRIPCFSAARQNQAHPRDPRAKVSTDDFLDRTAPKNMSEVKLRNSSFNDSEDEAGVSTRSQTSSSGMQQSIVASNCRMPSCFLSVSAILQLM